MKGIMKGIFFMTAILLIALALPFGTSSVSAQEESDKGITGSWHRGLNKVGCSFKPAEDIEREELGL